MVEKVFKLPLHDVNALEENIGRLEDIAVILLSKEKWVLCSMLTC